MGLQQFSCAMRWWAAVEWIDQVIQKGLKIVDEVEVFYVEGRSVSADLKQKKINLASASEDCGLGIRTIHHTDFKTTQKQLSELGFKV